MLIQLVTGRLIQADISGYLSELARRLREIHEYRSFFVEEACIYRKTSSVWLAHEIVEGLNSLRGPDIKDS
jgi:hypothetical protein